MRKAIGDGVPTISAVLDDRTLVEALYCPGDTSTALAVGSPGGEACKVQEFTTSMGERLIPYSASNNLLACDCVLLPSDIGEVRDKRDVIDDVQAYLRKYIDLDPTAEAIVAHYILLTWVYDAFNELPYLRFRGNYGTGKTRALLAAGSIAYKPFFASGASTVSPIFHVLDAFGATLVLDEADFRFSDATAELTKILNNGTVRGLPVLRTMANRHRELNPRAFRVFGPKIVSMREGFSDRALESRFLTIEMRQRPLRADIPIHLPDSLAVEARELRNKLLAWRFKARQTIEPNSGRLIEGMSPRLNQMALPLLSLIDEPDLRAKIAESLSGQEHRLRAEQQRTAQALAVRALADAFGTASAPYVSIAEVTRRYNELSDNNALPLSNKAVGAIVRRLGLTAKKSRGVYVISQNARHEIEQLAARYSAVEVATPAVEDDATVNHEVSSSSNMRN